MRQEYFHAIDVMIHILITVACIYAGLSIADNDNNYSRLSVRAVICAAGGLIGYLASWVVRYIADAFGISEAVLLLAAAGAAAVWFITAGKSIAKKKNRVLAIAFLIYIIGLLYIVIVSRIGNKIAWIRVDISEVVRQFSSDRGGDRIMHTLQNIIMFVPLGCFIVAISDGKSSVLKGLAAGVMLSVCIESVQLLFSIGECDIMDILANGAGCDLYILEYSRLPRKLYQGFRGMA